MTVTESLRRAGSVSVLQVTGLMQKRFPSQVNSNASSGEAAVL